MKSVSVVLYLMFELFKCIIKGAYVCRIRGILLAEIEYNNHNYVFSV